MKPSLFIHRIRFGEIQHYITFSPMDPLQWMGAVRMRVQTADKNVTMNQHEPSPSINILWREKLCVRKKTIHLYYMFNRAVTIHQTHDSVRITIFDPRFGSYHDFFRGGWEKKKERFLKQYFLLNNILKIFINWTPKNKINYANY